MSHHQGICSNFSSAATATHDPVGYRSRVTAGAIGTQGQLTLNELADSLASLRAASRIEGLVRKGWWSV